MKDIIINHCNNNILLDEFKRKAFNIIDDYDLKQIIQTLINKIIKLDAELTEYVENSIPLNNHISIKPKINK